MDIGEMIADHLERQARQQMLNQALFRLIADNGGEVTLSLEVMKGEDMGGVVIEVDPRAGTLTLKSMTMQQAEALEQSVSCDHH